MKNTLLFQLGVGLVLGFILILVGIQLSSRAYQYQGSLIDPPAVAPDFELTTANGRSFHLKEFRGEIVMLYFGYTFCPDVCPTTLYDLTRVKDHLGEHSDDLVVAMITVDPERDSLDRIGDYVTTFDPSFYGLSGDLPTLEPIWSAYGVYREAVEIESQAGYLVDHTARVYVIDRQGQLRLTFPFGMTWEAIADDLVHLLNE